MVQQTKIPLDETKKRYGYSKTKIYDFIKTGVFTPYYFPGSTKPFFDVREIESKLCPTADRGVKRKQSNYETVKV